MYRSTAVVFLQRTTRNFWIYQSEAGDTIHYEKRVTGHQAPDVLIVEGRTPTPEDLEDLGIASG